MALIQPQRFLAAEPKQLELCGTQRSPGAPASWAHPGALPSFTFKACHKTRAQPSPPSPPRDDTQPTVSVTSQYVKIVQDDGQLLFLPVRHIRRSKTTLTTTLTAASAVPGGGRGPRLGGSAGSEKTSPATPLGSGRSPRPLGVPATPQSSKSSRPFQRHYSMSSLGVGLERSQTFCGSASPGGWAPRKGSDKSSSASPGSARPSTIRQTTSFGRQITVNCLHGPAFDDWRTAQVSGGKR